MCSTKSSLCCYSDWHRHEFYVDIKGKEGIFAFTNCNCEQIQVHSTLLVKTPLVSTR